MENQQSSKLFSGFGDVTEDQFNAVYDAMSEDERRDFARAFFVMFSRLIDGQASVMDDILAQAKADERALPYVIPYGQRMARTMESIAGPLRIASDIWRKADGG